ncbi:MAG TPA: TetR/AcrR family transcriptional regulator [Hyphomicrobiaceae bacterium]|jgi:TetR/AcrR family transcriptional regulator|nr:TetR/AcrR family transcriptional regulator [Hyphomicrobiaceae bacterium]
MARPRAADHDLKRRAILDRSAKLFADRGYARTSMSEIALACGSSKALLYHYYENKEQLLHALLKAHFVKLEEAIQAADVPAAPPVERLRALIAALLAAYEGADALHKVQINELTSLPLQRQQELKSYERRLVELFAGVLHDINPALAEGTGLLKPVTMSVFGMINWSYLWFRPDGAMSRAAYANLVTQITVDGISSLGTVPLPVALGHPQEKAVVRRPRATGRGPG